MECILSDAEYIETVTCCLDFYNAEKEELVKEILHMLSVTCWYSDIGHSIVLMAMDTYRRRYRERQRYFGIVHAIKVARNLEYQTSCLTFVNTLVSACSDHEERVALRNDFLALDIVLICRAVKSHYENATKDQEPGDAINHESAQLFIKQLKVFETMMQSDIEESMMNDTDLSNVQDVLSTLQYNCKISGFSDNLLRVLHTLLLIPGEISLGSKTWQLVENSVLHITSNQYVHCR